VATCSNVTFTAATGITLQAGFSVEAGAEFLAEIAQPAGPPTGLPRDYVGGIEYYNGIMEAIYHAEGRVSFDNGQSLYEYNLTDHLGNLRLSFADRNGDGDVDITSDPATNEILQEHHYYPFGMAMEGDWVNNPVKVNRYRYNGKELEENFGLNWYAYGARYYDPAIGRFTGVDPLAEDYAGWSPYNYTHNNPIKLVDPDGRAPAQPEDDYRLKQDGTIELIRRTNDTNDKLFAYHLDGEPTGEVLEVKKGVLQKYKANEKSGADLGGDPFSSVELTNNKAATEIFEFLAENTIVEFSHVKFDKNGNAISTSHKSGSEGGGNKIAYDKIVKGSKVREKIHSHPTDGKPSPADKSDAAYWTAQNVTLKIYKVISKQYVEYDQNGEKK